MKTHRISGQLAEVRISPNEDKTEFRFRLEFRESERTESVEFGLPPETVMGLMMALQALQKRHRLPIPSSLRPQGPPSLSVVDGDDG